MICRQKRMFLTNRILSCCIFGFVHTWILLASWASSQSLPYYRTPWSTGTDADVLYSHAWLRRIEQDGIIRDTSASSSSPSITSMSHLTRVLTQDPSMTQRLLQLRDFLTAGGSTSISVRRFLSEKDFQQLNDLLAATIIQLPDMNDIQQDLPWPLTSAFINITDLICSHIHVDDVQLSWKKVNNQTLDVSLEIDGIDVDCDLNWSYHYDGGYLLGRIGSGGAAQIYLRDSNISTAVAFTSKDFQSYLPDAFDVQTCSANFNIADMNFQGSVTANIVNTFENAIRGQVRTAIANAVCAELDGASTQVNTMLSTVEDQIKQYLPPDGWSVHDVDPLQTSTNITKTDTLLDFSKEKMIGMLLEQADNFLYVGANSTNPFETGINKVIKSNLLDDQGIYELPVKEFLLTKNGIIFEGQDALTDTKILVKSIRVSGLDTFTKFDPLQVIGPQVLQSFLALKHLDIIADLTVDVKPSTLNDSIIVSGSTPEVFENITVSFGIKKIDVALAFFLGIDMSRVGDLELGSLLYSNQIVPCLFKTIRAAEVTQLVARIGDMSTPNMTGFISVGVDRVINEAADAAFTTLKSMILTSIPGLFQKTVRGALNSLLQKYLSNSTTTECPKPKAQGQGFVDFRDLLLPPDEAAAAGATGKSPYGDMAAKIMKTVKDSVLAPNPGSGLSRINDVLIDPFTASQSNVSGTILFKKDLVNNVGSFNLPGFSGSYHLKISKAQINNVDSVGTIHVLEPSPSDGYLLDNSAVVGAESKPLGAQARFLLKVEGDKLNLEDEIDFRIALEAAQISAALIAMVDTKSLLRFPLSDIKNPYCWLATIPAAPLDEFGVRLRNATNVSASLAGLDLSVQQANLGLKCHTCSSPGIEEMDKELQTASGIRESTSLINRVLKKLNKLLEGDFAQVHIDRILSEAAMRCPHLPTYDASVTTMQYKQMPAPSYVADTEGFFIAVLVALGCATGLVALGVFAINVFARRKHEKWLLALPEEDVYHLHTQQFREESLQAGLNRNTSSMCSSVEIPLVARLIMPLVVLGNIALFLSGHLSLGASVNIDVTVAGQKVTINNFFDFSMAKSTMDMWNAGARELAILIVIFSGIWPYTKQVIVLLMWFAPPRLVSVRIRGKVFSWLDTLGKWSVIDIYVLVVSVVAFRLTIGSPDQASFLASLYSVELMIVPEWGLYAMLIAQLISHVSSHFLIHYHRKIVDSGTRHEEQQHLFKADKDPLGAGGGTDSSGAPGIRNSPCELVGDRTAALRHHVYEVERSSKGKHLMVRPWFDVVLAFSGLSAVVLFVLGCALPSFRLEILGLVGIAVELGQSGAAAVNQYSLFSIVDLLIDLASYLSSPGYWLGLGALSLLLIFSTFLVPVTQVIVMLWLWFMPMTYNSPKRKKLMFFVEILQAWQYVEVYLISLLIATWQIGDISQFFFNDVVGGALNGPLGSMVYYGILTPENAQMFYVQANVQVGSYLLLAGAVLLGLLSQFILRAERQHMQQVAQVPDNLGQKRVYCSDHDLNDKKLLKSIKPVSLRFTDCFKWLLIASPDNAASVQCEGRILPTSSTFIESFDVAFDAMSVITFDAGGNTVASFDDSSIDEVDTSQVC